MEAMTRYVGLRADVSRLQLLIADFNAQEPALMPAPSPVPANHHGKTKNPRPWRVSRHWDCSNIETFYTYIGMALSIKNSEADRLVRQIAGLTGETLTAAVVTALRERLERVQAQNSGRSLADELDEIAIRCAALPMLDPRSPEEILGYGRHSTQPPQA